MVKLTIQIALIFTITVAVALFIALHCPAYASELAQKGSSVEVTPGADVSPSMDLARSCPILSPWSLDQAIKELRDSLNPLAFQMVASGYDPVRRVDWFDFLLGSRGLDSRWMARVRVLVSPLTGVAFVEDRLLKEAALEVRGDAALHLGVGLSDVFLKDFSSYRVVGIGSRTGYVPGSVTYQLTLKVKDFTLRYEAVGVRGQKSFTVKLVSLRNEIGVDLLLAAERHLKGLFNPDEYSLATWGDGDGVIGFAFKLKDGSIVKVNVDKKSGLASIPLPEGLEAAVMTTREEIAARMGVDIKEVHIDGIKKIPEDSNNFYGAAHFQITASVGHYRMVLDYREVYPYPWRWGNVGLTEAVITSVPIRSYQRIITLKSFVDNRTGRDYVSEALKEVVGLLNPENGGDYGVVEWSMINGNLRLSVGIPPVYGFWGIAVHLGGNIAVTVDLKSRFPRITIDPKIKDAVLKARQQTSEKLNLAMADVHVNFIVETWRFDLGVDDTKTSQGYVVSISTPKFGISFVYRFDTGALELESLYNKDAGVDAVYKAKNDLAEKNGFQYGAIHIKDFSVERWDDGREVISFSIKVDGKDETYGYTIDTKTGEILDSWIAIPGKDGSVPLKDTENETAQNRGAVLARILEKKAVEEKSRAASDNRFIPHLADEKDPLLALQTK